MPFSPCNLQALLPASFNGLTFYIDSAELSVKPGSARAEFIGVDKPASIDTSKNADAYSFEGWLIGEDVAGQAQAWRAAAAGQQPYTIMHPIFGSLTAGADSIKFESGFIENVQAVKVSFDGWEWGELPGSGAGGGGDLFGAIGDLLSLAATTFSDLYSLFDIAVWLLGSVETSYDTALSSVTSAAAEMGVPASIPPTSAWRDPVKAWSYLASPLVTPPQLTPIAVTALTRLVNELGVSIPATPAQRPIDAIYHCTRLVAIVALGNAVMAQSYLTPGQVCIARDSVVGPLLAEFAIATQRGDVAMMDAIAAYKASFVYQMTQILAGKAPVVSYLFPNYTNSLKVAHDVYGDASRFAEIEALNISQSPFALRGTIYALAG
jgi:hypothetical protein